MNRYLVTGGSGFIGTNLVDFHVRAGDRVLNFDVAPPRNVAHHEFWQSGSLLDSRRLAGVIDEFRPTHIYHLGARTDLDGATVHDYGANTAGVKNLIGICNTQSELRRVLFASSRLVCKIGYEPRSYDDFCPSTAYGESKVAGEKIVSGMGSTRWSWSIFRPTSIWGPWFGVPYRTFFDAVRKGRYLHPSGLKVLKSFGYVGNAVFQIAALMKDEKVRSRTFYVGDYEPIEVFRFAELVADQFGVRAPRQVPFGVLRCAGLIGDTLQPLGLRAPLTSFRLRNLITPMIHNFEDLRKIVGDLPFSTEEGVASTVEWMSVNG